MEDSKGKQTNSHMIEVCATIKRCSRMYVRMGFPRDVNRCTVPSGIEQSLAVEKRQEHQKRYHIIK